MMPEEKDRNALGAVLLLVGFLASGAFWSHLPELPVWNRLEAPANHALIRLVAIAVHFGWME